MTQETVAVLGHDYDEVVKAPTCENGGYTTYTCTACGDNYKANETSELGHNMSDFIVVKQPTCTENGTEKSTCSRCSHFETKTVSAKGHSYEDNVCKVCGDKKVDNCSHLCHKTGFLGFIWKIVRFFQKLFRMNPVCECGAIHY